MLHHCIAMETGQNFLTETRRVLMNLHVRKSLGHYCVTHTLFFIDTKWPEVVLYKMNVCVIC